MNINHNELYIYLITINDLHIIYNYIKYYKEYNLFFSPELFKNIKLKNWKDLFNSYISNIFSTGILYLKGVKVLMANKDILLY